MLRYLLSNNSSININTMVNYCCVRGCGRNSKNSGHLIFFSLPKVKSRQEDWLKAGGREDLLSKLQWKQSFRVCARHFAPKDIKNKKLCPDAAPTLCLPSYDTDQLNTDPVKHTDLICNSCKKTIHGFCYKCVTCIDYDLCAQCEHLERHAHHYMLRIPRPLKFKIADDLIQKWRDFFKEEHVQPDCTQISDDSSYCSSDDEPITKYSRSSDSGVDLSADVKDTIRKEIDRVLSRNEQKLAQKRLSRLKRMGGDIDKKSKKLKVSGTRPQKVETVSEKPVEIMHEVVFADVNEVPGQVEVKPEMPVLTPAVDVPDPEIQPLMHVKLSDDFTELMIEMTRGGDKTIYKYDEEEPTAIVHT